MSFKRVLITGGAGFIGSHLVDALLEAGRQVTIVDNLSTGRWQNVAHRSRDPNLRVLIASASDERLMDEEIRQHDLVYHLASAVGVKLIMQQPVKTIDTIVLSTEVVLRLCSRYRRPVLLTSTSEIYGKSTEVPFRETDDVVMGATEKRRWAYACAKAMDEFLARAHYYETQLPVFIVRLFNTVGPRQTGHYGMVIPTFVRQALDGAPLTVYGTGQQKRCFCSVFDVVQGLIRLPEVEEATGMVVNLGSQNEISIENLARRVVEVTGSSSGLCYVPYEEAYGEGFDDMFQRIPELARARQLVGWEPRYGIDDIIRQVADDMRRG
jgi:UDP-glucose 4-epimerase